jgi:hypothetical protein
MLKYILVLALFMVPLTSNSAFALDQCKDILAGLISYKTTLNDQAFEQQYINWLNSNEYSSSQSTSTASGSLGLTIPVDGVPINFAAKFSKGQYGSQSYSKSLATYLSENTSERSLFFQKLREANPAVVKAWSDCQSARLTKKGMYCSVNQGANPDEIELYVNYLQFAGDSVPQL